MKKFVDAKKGIFPSLGWISEKNSVFLPVISEKNTWFLVMKNENTYFNRKIDNELEIWKNEDNHKPLLLRGARQVGNSYFARKFCRI